MRRCGRGEGTPGGLLAVALLLACAPGTPSLPEAAIELLQPAPGSRGVARGAPVVATFREPLAPSTATGAEALRVEFVGEGTAALLPGVWSLEDGNRSLTFTPARDRVPFGARVRVTLGTGLRTVVGAKLAAPVTYEFRVEEPPPLRLVRVSPPEGMAALDRAPEVQLVFSEPPECDDFGELDPASSRVTVRELRDAAPRWADADGEERVVAGRWSCRRMPSSDPNRSLGACHSSDRSDATDYCVVRFLAAAREKSGSERTRLLVGWGSRLLVRLPGGGDESPLRSARATSVPNADGPGAHLAGGLASATTLTLQVAHPPPLVLVSGQPSVRAGGTSAARSANVTLAFSESVSCASLAGVGVAELFDARTAQLRGQARRDVAGRWSCEGQPEDPEQEGCAEGGCTVVFTPTPASGEATAFVHSSTVELTLPGGRSALPVESVRATTGGGRLAEGVSFSFPVEDPPPLQLLRSAPAPDATEARRDGAIELQFSEPPDCDALLAATTVEETLPGGGAAAAVDGRWGCLPPPAESPAAPGAVFLCGGAPDRCRVTFTPLRPLAASSTVAVTLRGGTWSPGTLLVRSARSTARGGTLPSTVRFTFRTADPPPLFASIVSPAPGARAVAPDAALGLVFSEPVDCASLGQRASLRARDLESTLDREVPGDWSCPPPPPDDPSLPEAARCGEEGARCRVAFVPRGGWPWSAEVRVTLPGGPGPALAITSARATARGGRLAATLESRFTTADPPSPVLEAVSPAAGSEGRLPGESLRLRFSTGGAGLRCASVIPCTGRNDADCTLRVTEVLDPLVGDTPAGDEAARVRLTAVSPLPLGCEDGGLEVVWQPDPQRPFARSSQIEVVVSGGAGPAVEGLVTTPSGGRLATTTRVSWRVLDPPELRVTSTSPVDGATGVPTAPPIRLDFDGPLDCAAASRAGVEVEERAPATLVSPQAPPPRLVPVQRRCVESRLELLLERPLAGSAEVVVNLDGTLLRRRDATTRGGSLGSQPGLSFRVADPPALQVVGFAPGPVVDTASDLRVTFDRELSCASLVDRLLLLALTEDGPAEPVSGTIACTTGLATGPQVNGATALFTPSRALEVNRRHRLEVRAGVVPTDATIAGGSLRGVLPQAWSTEFQVVGGALRIVSALPRSTSSAPVASLIDLRFDQPVEATSLRPCGPGGIPAGCNVWVNPGAASDRTAAVGLALRRVDASGLRIVLDPEDGAAAPNLAPDRTYAVTVLGGEAGPNGGPNRSLLAADVSWTFETLAERFVLATRPADGDPAAEPGSEVCVEFADELDVASLTSGGVPQLELTTTDDSGRTLVVPLATDGPGP